MRRKFELEKDYLDNLVVVAVSGVLDSKTFDKLRDCLQELLDEEKTRIIVDMENLEYLSSAGIGVLFGIHKDIRRKKGDIKLCNLPVKVKNLFVMLGFSRIFKIYDNREEAVEGFTKDKDEEEKENDF